MNVFARGKLHLRLHSDGPVVCVCVEWWLKVLHFDRQSVSREISFGCSIFSRQMLKSPNDLVITYASVCVCVWVTHADAIFRRIVADAMHLWMFEMLKVDNEMRCVMIQSARWIVWRNPNTNIMQSRTLPQLPAYLVLWVNLTPTKKRFAIEQIEMCELSESKAIHSSSHSHNQALELFFFTVGTEWRSDIPMGTNGVSPDFRDNLLASPSLCWNGW